VRGAAVIPQKVGFLKVTMKFRKPGEKMDENAAR
jgi:hypothetical protein